MSTVLLKKWWWWWRWWWCSAIPIVQARNFVFGLIKLAAAACMQCTVQRKQKAANTNLLESRNLLQTSTLVFPRPIVCSHCSLVIILKILAKKIARPPTGACPPAPGWIRHCRYISYSRENMSYEKFKRSDNWKHFCSRVRWSWPFVIACLFAP